MKDWFVPPIVIPVAVTLAIVTYGCFVYFF
jgi:hypothetical protein